MVSENFITLEELCTSHLKKIKGVDLTDAELDTVACILLSKGPREIARFFDIEVKTVEVHKKNINQKLQCHNLEEIKTFIINAEKLSWLEKYQKNILPYHALERRLKKLTSFISRENLQVLLAYEEDVKAETPWIILLKKHLEYVGIKTILATSCAKPTLYSFIESTATLKRAIICVGSKEFMLGALKEMSLITSPLRVIAIMVDTAEEVLPLGKEIETNYIFLEKESSYGVLIIKLLKKIFLSEGIFSSSIAINLNKIFSPHNMGIIASIFKETSLRDGLLPTTLVSSQEEEKHTFFFKKLVRNFLCINPSYKKYLIGILIMGIALSGVLVIVWNTTNFPFFKHISNVCNIRTDLHIPDESIFLERRNLLEKIYNNLKAERGIQTTAIVGVVGIGGVGKTTLARKFARSYKGPVVWELNAETKTSLFNSFQDRTKNQKREWKFIQSIQDPERKEKQLLFFVQENLRQKPQWLLLYDNFSIATVTKDYLPDDPQVWGNGKVIITTRDSNIKNSHNIKPQNIIQIEELSEREKLTLFSKLFYSIEPDMLKGDKKEKAINFLKDIPSFPLDVTIAASYLKNNPLSFSQYLEKLETFDNEFEEGLKLALLKK